MRKTIDIVGIASVVSFLLGWVTAAIWSDAGEKQPEPRSETRSVAVQTVKVLVAKSGLPMYKALRDNPGELFVEKECAVGDLPKDALKADELAKLQGKFLNRNLGKGHYVTMEDVACNPPQFPDADLNFVEIQADLGLNGLSFERLPGQNVDIIWFGRRGENNEVFAKLVAENVRVLTASPLSEDENAIPRQVSALLAVAASVETELVQCMKNGSLRLALNFRRPDYIEQYSVKDLLKPRKKSPIEDVSKEDARKQAVTPGMRAVGILLDIDVPGYAFPPGSRVDIIWVGKAEGAKNLSTKIIVQDAIVLEMVCGLSNQSELQPQRVQCIITVGVMPDNQMVLIQALETGRLTVIRHEDNAATPAAKTGKD